MLYCHWIIQSLMIESISLKLCHRYRNWRFHGRRHDEVNCNGIYDPLVVIIIPPFLRLSWFVIVFITGFTIGAGPPHSFWAPEFIPSFSGVCVSHCLVINVVFFLSVFVFLSLLLRRLGSYKHVLRHTNFIINYIRKRPNILKCHHVITVA